MYMHVPVVSTRVYNDCTVKLSNTLGFHELSLNGHA